MAFLISFLVSMLISGAAGRASVTFDHYFTSQTMRVDYYHSGTASEEHFSLDQIVLDGPWPGSRTVLVDPTNLGKYLFEVMDPESTTVIYSRGFASVYGEWETTGEAKKTWRTFHESLRFPWPKVPVEVVLKKRDRRNDWQEIWRTSIDPSSRFVVKAQAPPGGRAWTLFEHGDPAGRVDLLLIGDGYSATEMDKFHSDVKRLVDVLFEHEPFRSRKSSFNVRAIDLPAAESGVSRPHAGIFRRSVLSASYSTFDLERYVLTYANRTVRDIASAVPYELFVILLNERTYGGGGIFNCQATCAADSAYANYVFVHEIGHQFAGLGDEYYTSEVAYETGAAVHPEPWEPNLTALHDPAKLKWRDLVEPGIPIPTPWRKEEFERDARRHQQERSKITSSGSGNQEVEAAFSQQQKLETALLADSIYAGKVGAFEGAGYEVNGLYRPTLDCIMFSRNKVSFCPVCRRAIETVIDLYAAP